ncbi:MAG TPA: hypothetical protein VI072_26300 [Polyangiaceae bacterium]
MPRLERWISIASSVALSAFLLGACGDELSVGQDFAAGGASGADGASGAGGTLGGAGGLLGDGQADVEPPECSVVKCRDQIYQCGDCHDNDADELKDAADPECLGACDNTEDSFHDGRTDQTGTRCRQDCYFDRDTGAGNDDCHWTHQCDPKSVADAYPPSGDAECAYDANARIPGVLGTCVDHASSQSQTCKDICGPLTPNGCDCFGCCELPAGSGRHVYLGSSRDGRGSCDPSVVGDPERCRPCTYVPDCYNPCTECEFCVGRGAPAPTCTNGGSRCPPGVVACDLSAGIACDARHYCVTGCCAPLAF